MLSHGDSSLCTDATRYKFSQRSTKPRSSKGPHSVGTNMNMIKIKINLIKLFLPANMSPKEKEVEEPKNMQQATIIVGFPGIGKSTLKQNATAGKYQPWNIEQILDEPNYAKGNEAAFLAGLRELAKEPDTVLLLPAHRFVGSFLTPASLSPFRFYC